MLELFYNYAKQTQVPQGGGVAIVPKFVFADYIEAMLTVYSSSTTPMDLSNVASWRGAVDVDSDAATEPLVRLLPDVFDPTDAASGKIGLVIDCNTVIFRDGVTTGKAGFLEIYGHDSEDRQIVRIRIAATLLPAIDPPGDLTPSAVPDSSVRTLNGISGDMVIKDSAGNTLSVVNQAITIPAGVSVNGLSGAVVLTDASGTPLSVDGQTVIIPGADCTGDVTAAGDNTLSGANTFEQPLTVAGNAVSGLHCDDDPLDAYQAYDVDLRPYTWLDGTIASPEIALKNYLLNLQRITAMVKSENAESSGNVVLVAKRPNGTEIARATVAVTPNRTLKTLLNFDNVEGAIEITRDTTDAADTLPGAIVIYAISTWRAE